MTTPPLNPKDPLRAFTLPGRILVAVSVIFCLLGFYVTIDRDFFSPGFYPLIVLLLPGFGGALALFCVGCIVYKMFGITVWATSADDSTEREEGDHMANGASGSGGIGSNNQPDE